MERKLKCLWPPYGAEVRKAIGWYSLCVGIPRILIQDGSLYSPLRFVDPWVYGVIMTILGILLLATACSKRRITVYGKVVAGISFVAWMILAAATTSLTSLGINLGVSASLLMEVWVNDHA